MTTETALKPLSDAMLAEIDAASCTPPSYERSALPTRVLHIGPGAFFRAHQMDYYNRLNANEPKWGVTAVALRSKGTSEKLNAQDGLYTLIKLDRETSCEIIAALKGVKFRDDASAFEPFTTQDLQLVTLTVTEKGYCLNGDGELDETHTDIAHDLKQFDTPVSAIGWLTKGLALRRESGVGKLVVLSCDNLPAMVRNLKRRFCDLPNWSMRHSAAGSAQMSTSHPAWSTQSHPQQTTRLSSAFRRTVATAMPGQSSEKPSPHG